MSNPILDMFQRSTTPAQAPTSNPLDGAKSYVSSHGGDSKTAFMNLCKENGINMPNVQTPEEAFNILKSQMNIGNVIQRLFGR